MFAFSKSHAATILTEVAWFVVHYLMTSRLMVGSQSDTTRFTIVGRTRTHFDSPCQIDRTAMVLKSMISRTKFLDSPRFLWPSPRGSAFLEGSFSDFSISAISLATSSGSHDGPMNYPTPIFDITTKFVDLCYPFLDFARNCPTIELDLTTRELSDLPGGNHQPIDPAKADDHRQPNSSSFPSLHSWTCVPERLLSYLL